MAVRKIRGQFQISSRRFNPFSLYGKLAPPPLAAQPGVFSPSKQARAPEDHPHPHPEDNLPFNVTHRIRELSFGPKVRSGVGPLDGIKQTMHEGTPAWLRKS